MLGGRLASASDSAGGGAGDEQFLLRVEQAARLLGISPKSCYRWISEGVIPKAAVLRVGGAIYMRTEALRKWASDGGQKR